MKNEYTVTVETAWADGTVDRYDWTGITAHGFDHAASRALNKATAGDSPHLRSATATAITLEVK